MSNYILPATGIVAGVLAVPSLTAIYCAEKGWKDIKNKKPEIGVVKILGAGISIGIVNHLASIGLFYHPTLLERISVEIPKIATASLISSYIKNCFKQSYNKFERFLDRLERFENLKY